MCMVLLMVLFFLLEVRSRVIEFLWLGCVVIKCLMLMMKVVSEVFMLVVL